MMAAGMSMAMAGEIMQAKPPPRRLDIPAARKWAMDALPATGRGVMIRVTVARAAIEGPAAGVAAF